MAGSNAGQVFDDLENWALQNHDTSPLFIYFFNPIKQVSETVYDNLLLLLERMTFLGVIVGAVAIALVVAGWRKGSSPWPGSRSSG